MSRTCSMPGCGRRIVVLLQSGAEFGNDEHDLCRQHWRSQKDRTVARVGRNTNLHRCACGKPIGPLMVACGPHWLTVPPDLRAALMAAFNRDRGSPAHLRLVVAARAEVVARLSKSNPHHQREGHHGN